MSDIQKNGWAEKASKMKAERLLDMARKQIEGETEANAPISHAPAGGSNDEEVAGDVTKEGSGHPNEHMVANEVTDASSEPPNGDNVANASSSQSVPQTPTRRVHCDICDTTMSANSIYQHRKSKIHIRALEAQSPTFTPPAYDPDKDVWCPLCHKSYPRDRYFYQHIKTEGHMKREAALGNPPPGFLPTLPDPKVWTIEQDEQLLRLYFDMKGDREIQEAMPQWSYNAIMERRRWLVNKNDSEEHTKLLNKVMEESKGKGK